jgi:tRNA (guanine37-N1)-methyltransferase
MRIDIVNILPELLQGPFDHSIVKRAVQKGLVEINLINLRDYSTQKQKSVDDYAYGGGAGMVMCIEPIANCLEALKGQRTYDEVIYLTPDGERLRQPLVNRLSIQQNLILLCGHYKGVDERVRQHLITMEISIGDFVISGGELGAAVLTDALVRLLPGAISDETSALSDSFQDNLLAPPVYTRPAVFRGWEVPPVLLSGDPNKVEAWRTEQSLERTRSRRPDLLDDGQQKK